MSRPLNTWEDHIEWQAERGLAADEIADLFDQPDVWNGELPTRSGEWLSWGSLHGRRRILPLIAAATGTPLANRPTGTEWAAIVHQYREWMTRNGTADRPTQSAIAAELGMGERTLTAHLRALGVKDWHVVHALVLTEG